MSHNIYALLVGINEYPNKEHWLQGCINDMEGWKRYLENRARKTGYGFHPMVLKNEAATRQAIIDGFIHHLSQATADDTVVFFFGGHGSEEIATPLFKSTSDELNQTLVCWDSRTSSWDLLDKELSSLIAYVARENPQITIILDCCHSGSGSRVLGERRLLRRDLESSDGNYKKRDTCFYIDKDGQPVSCSETNADSKRLSVGPFDVFKGCHVLLAACQEKETAKEVLEMQTAHGVFSFYAQKALEKSLREMTYMDLFTQIRRDMQGKVHEQAPQLEVIMGDGGERQQFFLSKARQPECKGIFSLSFVDENWSVNGGYINGWFQENTEIELAVFPFTSAPQAIRKGEGQCAIARVTKVDVNQSTVCIEGGVLNPELLYKSLLVKAPASTLTVFVGGVESRRNALKEVLSTTQNTQVSIEIVSDRSAAMIVLFAEEGSYHVYRGPVLGDPTQAAMATFSYDFDVFHPLAHIAQWHRLMNLQNTTIGRIPRGGLELQLVQNGKVLTGSEVQLDYIFSKGRWKVPGVKLQLINRTSVRLFCSVLDLSSEFSINPELLPAMGAWVEKKQLIDVAELGFEIPLEFLDEEAFEYQNLYKVIASTEPFDTYAWKQGYLCDLSKPQPAQLQERRSTVLKDVEENSQADWTTCELLVRNIWPDQDGNRVDSTEFWDADEDVLFAELAMLSERSPIVTERPIEMRADVLVRSSIVTERPVAMRSELTVVGKSSSGFADDAIERGRQVFHQVASVVYQLLCSPVENDDDSDLAKTLTKLVNSKAENAERRAIDLLSPVLLQSLEIPQTMALVIATLLIKKAVTSNANLVCEHWRETLFKAY